MLSRILTRAARSALVWALLAVFYGSAFAADSMWVEVGQTGRLIYQMDGRGDRIMDFSNVGYGGGTVPLPTYSDVVAPADIITVNPMAGDNLANIQAAINAAAAKPLNANGFRGVVQLSAGTFDISNSINITTSGIILRGVGDGTNPASSTILRSTFTGQFDPNASMHNTMIVVDSNASRSNTNTHNIIDKTVPVGATSLTVDTTSGYAVGDSIIITRPANQAWINAIHMDATPPATGGTAPNEGGLGTEYWVSNQGDPVGPPPKAGSTQYNQVYERKITYIDQTNKRIFFDAPLPSALEKRYGTLADGTGFAGTISKTSFNRTNNVGIENLRGDGFAAYVPGVTAADDEAHAANFLVMQDTSNGWVKNISTVHLIYTAVEVGTNSRNVTVDDASSTDFVSVIDSPRRYPFNIEGSLTLMKNLTVDGARHEFVDNTPSRGPNVFLDATATNGHADSGGHQRWSTGTLFDNITTNTTLDAENRLQGGSGQGWSGANFVIWNSKASQFYVQNPPTAQNWLIGSTGENRDVSHAAIGPYPAYYDQSDTPGGSIQPGNKITLGSETSLYRAQLAQRMAHPTEEQREYWVGDFDNYVLDPGEATPVDSTWLSQVQAANPGKTVNGMDAPIGANNVIVPFTFSFDVPNKPVRSAVLTIAMHGGGLTPLNDQIFIESTSNAVSIGSPVQFPLASEPAAINPDISSQVITLEFSPTDVQKALSFLTDGKLNLMVSDDHTVDWADLTFTLSNQSSAWTGAINNVWAVNGVQNWNDGNAGTPYFDGDVVSFGDGPTNRFISISGSVSPGAITVNNSSSANYTFTGGAITGGTGILKQGAGTLTLSGANTYTGATLIQGGIVSIDSLANGGLASNLGASSNAAANLALDGGTLRWTGSGDATTDRLFTLGAGGGTIDASPTVSSALVFSNTGTMGLVGSGARTLTLTGTELDLSNIKGNTLSAVIGDAAVGQPTSIIKNGNNFWSLDGTNSYSGGTTINAGRLRPGQATSFGTGLVTVADGAQAYLSVNGTVSNAFSIAGNGITETINGASANLGALRIQSNPTLTGQITLAGNARITAHTDSGTLAGKITGGFALELGGGGSTSSFLTLSNTANDWSGGLTISRGTVSLGAANVIPSGAGKGNVTINAVSGSGNTSLLDLNGFNETINGLASSGTAANAQITNTAAGAVTLTVGDNNQTSTFGGVIKNTVGAGTLGLTKIGAGTLTLAGTANANTYAGTTTVNNGTLQLNATHTLKKLKLDGAAATLSLNTALSSAKSFEVTAAGGSINHNGNAFGVVGGAGETITWNSGAQLDVQGSAPGKAIFTLVPGSTVSVADNTAKIVVHPGATLELTTAISATSSGSNFVNIQNDSTTSFKVTGTNQQVGNVDGLGNTTIAANANLVAARVVQNSLSIQGDATHTAAALTVRRSGGNPQGLNSQVSVVNSFSLANNGATIVPPPSGGYGSAIRQYFAKLDLVNNDLIIKNGSPSLFAEVQDMIRAGVNGTGGITSQEARSSGEYAGVTWLGSLYNGFDDDNNPNTPDVPILNSFEGVTLVGGEILMKYTWFGDADLDGLVTSLDFGLLLAGLGGNDPNKASNPWLFGDFDYNGIIDSLDYGLLLAGIGAGGNTIELPEPTGCVLAAVGVLALALCAARRDIYPGAADHHNSSRSQNHRASPWPV